MFTLSSDPTHNPFVEFVGTAGFYVAIVFAILISVALVIVLILAGKKTKNFDADEPKGEKSSSSKTRIRYSKNEILDALGGRGNVIAHDRMGSRIFLELKNNSLLNSAKLNSLGVSSVIKMSEKIVLVVKDDPESFDSIFN